MKIAVIHNQVEADDAPDTRDVLQQVASVSEALNSLGHEVVRGSCGLDLEAARRELAITRPDLVFNLVEELAGHGRLIHLFPSLLDALAIPYTGAPAEAVYLTSNKILAKERLLQAGLPTPAWAGPWPAVGGQRRPAAGVEKWIIKSLWEHASIGLDAGSVLATDSAATLSAEMRKRCAALGGACFAEQFIDGREFNLSLLGGKDGPEVLPPAEILFSGYTPDMLRIVDYQAKWDEGSFHYHHTPRTFDFGPADADLLQELTEIARRCWHAFGLAGYARVDFRVDEAGHPFILEVNTNPCLSPDAGFAAALARSGITFAQAMARIVADALQQYVQESVHKPAPRPHGSLEFRQEVADGDTERVGELVASTGFFHRDEVAVAVELVAERLAKGDASGYYFLLAEQDGRVVGYSCYGPIPCTQASFDLYWIVVHPDFQGQGLGRRLLEESEQKIRKAGGLRVYVDTSQREQYASTRAFYERCGYVMESLLVDFYAPGDGKAVYCKNMEEL